MEKSYYLITWRPAFFELLKSAGDESVAGLAIYGPEATECVKFTADGLHIKLPAGYPRQRPGTGVGEFQVLAGVPGPGGSCACGACGWSGLVHATSSNRCKRG